MIKTELANMKICPAHTVTIENEVNIELIIKQYEFVSEEILSKFREVKNRWITETYLYLVNHRIVSFVVMMEENLKCGFLHYHIASEHKEYFIKNYPALDKKINQILYVYTDVNYRRNGLATQLIDFVLKDMFKRNFNYVWLKKETHSQIYEKLGFKNFLKATEEILSNDAEQFFQDYKQRFGYDSVSLIRRYNDIRLVKILP